MNHILEALDTESSLNQIIKMQMLTNARGLLIGTLVLWTGCYGQVPPPPHVQPDISSGNIVLAGSIGIAALAATASFAAMSGLQNYMDCNCEDEQDGPEVECEALVETERQRCQEEKEVLEEEVTNNIQTTCRKSLGQICASKFEVNPDVFQSCISCVEKLDDEDTCSDTTECIVANGVCVYMTSEQY